MGGGGGGGGERERETVRQSVSDRDRDTKKFEYRSPVNMPDPIRIRSGLVWKHWPEAGRMVLAHRLASRSDLFGQSLTQLSRAERGPGWFCTII